MAKIPWFRQKIGKLTVEHIGRDLHTCKNNIAHSPKQGQWTFISVTYLAVLWDGVEKWKLPTGVQVRG